MTLEETQELTPTVFPFLVRIYSKPLHLFMYCCALCALRHTTQEVCVECLRHKEATREVHSSCCPHLCAFLVGIEWSQNVRAAA